MFYLSSSQDSSDLEQVADNTPAQGLAVISDALISTTGIPNTGHVRTPMGYD